MILQTVVLSVLLCSVYSFTIQAGFEKNEEYSGNSIEDDDLSISTLLEKANTHVERDSDEPMVVEGDIAVPAGLGNADPCTARNCKWRKATDGNVYVPYIISSAYSQRERDAILQGLRSFAASTCIRFTPRRRNNQDYLSIESRNGCYSFLGRTGGRQVVSLMRRGCVFLSTIQHELLHALGFNHEQTRSDRDNSVRILFENVISGLEYNFEKKATRNLNTSYDYNSVMHYGRFAFSKNGQATIEPIPNPDVSIGRARRMSFTDILRVNRLYNCNEMDRLYQITPVYFHTEYDSPETCAKTPFPLEIKEIKRKRKALSARKT